MLSGAEPRVQICSLSGCIANAIACRQCFYAGRCREPMNWEVHARGQCHVVVWTLLRVTTFHAIAPLANSGRARRVYESKCLAHKRAARASDLQVALALHRSALSGTAAAAKGFKNIVGLNRMRSVETPSSSHQLPYRSPDVLINCRIVLPMKCHREKFPQRAPQGGNCA